MGEHGLVFPMLAMVFLTITVLGILLRSRIRAVKSGRVDMAYFKVFQGVEPEETAKPARHLSNLFEAPVLFYAGCITAMVVHDTGVAMVAIAWAYVVARVVHAIVHLGRNRIRQRLRAYFSSWVVLLALWIHLGVHVAMA